MATIEKVKFENGIPIELALRYAKGRSCTSQITGDEQIMFTSDRGTFFVSAEEGRIINYQMEKLGIQAGERIQIVKQKEFSGQGRSKIEWTVQKLGYRTGEQPDGTFAVPAAASASELEEQLRRSLAQMEKGRIELARAGASTPTPVSDGQLAHHHNNSNGTSNGHANGNGRAPDPPNVHQGWAQFLLSTTNAITDVYAAALLHAQRHNGAVNADDVRTFLVTAYINQSKGGRNVA